jgi:hypothetical protein
VRNAIQTFHFHGDEILTFQRGGEPMVAMRRIVENLGMAWKPQTVKLMAQKDKFNCDDMVTVAPDGKRRAMLCMPVAKLALWLATINPNKITDLVTRAKVERYQAESAVALVTSVKNYRKTDPTRINRFFCLFRHATSIGAFCVFAHCGARSNHGE